MIFGNTHSANINLYCNSYSSCNDVSLYCSMPPEDSSNVIGECNIHCNGYYACYGAKIFHFNGLKSINVISNNINNYTYTQNLFVFCGFIFDDACQFELSVARCINICGVWFVVGFFFVLLNKNKKKITKKKRNGNCIGACNTSYPNPGLFLNDNNKDVVIAQNTAEYAKFGKHQKCVSVVYGNTCINKKKQKKTMKVFRVMVQQMHVIFIVWADIVIVVIFIVKIITNVICMQMDCKTILGFIFDFCEFKNKNKKNNKIKNKK